MKTYKGSEKNLDAPRTQIHPLREARTNSLNTQYGERPYLSTCEGTKIGQLSTVTLRVFKILRSVFAKFLDINTKSIHIR